MKQENKTAKNASYHLYRDLLHAGYRHADQSRQQPPSADAGSNGRRVDRPGRLDGGLGFTLTSTSPDFAVITGSDFCVGPITSPCSTRWAPTRILSETNLWWWARARWGIPGPGAFDDASMMGVGSLLN